MPIIGDQAAASAAAFVLQELSGERRTLSLTGRALPYKTLELSGSMRATVTFYAGNPVGTLQVLGAQEEPTTINGQWKDRFIQTTDFAGQAVSSSPGAAILDGVALTDVRALVRLVDDFRRKGQLLEMRWDEQVRRGLLSRFTSRWQNVHDVEWEMQFVWISRGEEVAPPTLTEVDQQSVSAEVQNASANARASTEWPGGAPSAWPATVVSATTSVFETIEQLNKDIESVEQEAIESVAKTVSQATSPIDAAYRMLATLQHAADAAQNVMDFTQAKVDRALINQPIETITLGQTLIASLYLHTLRGNGRRMRSVALRNREAMRDKVGLRAAPIVHIVQQDQDLRAVATQFYGRPDDWRRIALFNGFDGATVAVGTKILIPPASQDASRAGVV